MEVKLFERDQTNYIILKKTEEFWTSLMLSLLNHVII